MNKAMLKEAIYQEYQRCYSHLCEKLGKERVDTVFALFDEALEEALKHQFDNFAEHKE
ncbi:hypothetical protein [Bacillus cereus]|uniref:hypothetical protein n=1 Tax=Bacillus cereus TaxID=1396 RepID=UPI0003AB1C7A|nr:hypothetical protein [Bacillus cereus]